MIDKTSFAVSRDETRPVLNGVLWRIGPEGMAMVATDGSRLAEFRHSATAGNGGSAEVILPPQLCAQLSKRLEGPEDLISATLGDSRVLFDLGDTQILSRLIEGPYVDYEQVVPKGNENRLTIEVARLLPAMRRVSILASSYTRQVRMSLTGDSVELTASSQEVGGEAREVLPASYAAESLEVAYNSQFFMDILRRLDSGDALMELKDSATAAIVRPAQQGEGQEVYYLLMPMRPSG
jgi:DNA polymerase-3 subunit beta